MEKERLIAIMILGAVAVIAVIGLLYANAEITGMVVRGPPTDHPGQGQGVPFGDDGTTPEPSSCDENPDVAKCEALRDSCQTICEGKSGQTPAVWVVTQNYAVYSESEPFDDPCKDNPGSVYIESCTVTEGEAPDKEICIDVICACYSCKDPTGAP